VFDIGVGDNAYFIVMEYVDGADLKAVVEHRKKRSTARSPSRPRSSSPRRSAKGLAYAHELTSPDGKHLHIVHRDMSPPNVLITKHGEVKIVDFGLAKASSQLEKSEAGIIKGKFSYLAPEAAAGATSISASTSSPSGSSSGRCSPGKRLFFGDTDFQTVQASCSDAVDAASSRRSTAPSRPSSIASSPACSPATWARPVRHRAGAWAAI
jgi:serine/threonine protein kinase